MTPLAIQEAMEIAAKFVKESLAILKAEDAARDRRDDLQADQLCSSMYSHAWLYVNQPIGNGGVLATALKRRAMELQKILVRMRQS
jgi:hypothetical protein